MQASCNCVLFQVEYLMNLFPVPVKKEKIRAIGDGPDLVYPCGFFDGATTTSLGGVGVNIVISRTHKLSFMLGCGSSTNTRAELLDLWTLLLVAHKMGLPFLRIYDDSSFIINWANNKASLTSLELNHWCDNTMTLMNGFSWMDIRHVYQEHNHIADILSKYSLILTPGLLCFSEIFDGSISKSGEFDLF